MNARLVIAVFAATVFQVSAHDAPAPLPELTAAEGAWCGKLTYRDYARPDRLVTLPTRLHVALSAPDEIVLHYIYDDGPNKIVHSYERMAFYLDRQVVAWTSGGSKGQTREHRLTGSELRDGSRVLSFEDNPGSEKGTTSRYVVTTGANSLTFTTHEESAAAGLVFRNKYEFERRATCDFH